MNYSLFLRLSYHYFVVIRTQQETNAIVRLHNADGEKQFMSNSRKIIENVKCSLYMYDVLNSYLMAYLYFNFFNTINYISAKEVLSLIHI